MAENPFVDVEVSKDAYHRRVTLPSMQWLNRDPKSTDPQCVCTTGGFFSENQLLPDMKPGYFVNEDEERVVGFFTARIEAAILMHRQRWIVEDSNHTPVAFPTYRDAEEQLGAAIAKKGRSHVQIALLLRGDPERTPVALTLRGMASDGCNLWQGMVDKALAVPATRWKRAASKNNAASELPPWAFWVAIEVGSAREVGSVNKKKITPPVLVLPKAEGPEQMKQVLIAQFVGKPIVTLLEQWILTAGKEWRSQWKIQNSSTGNPAPTAPPAEGSEPPPPDDEWAQ